MQTEIWAVERSGKNFTTTVNTPTERYPRMFGIVKKLRRLMIGENRFLIFFVRYRCICIRAVTEVII